MLDALQAATFLQVLSRNRTLTELDAARALSSAARLLASDPLRMPGRVRLPARPRLGSPTLQS